MNDFLSNAANTVTILSAFVSLFWFVFKEVRRGDKRDEAIAHINTQLKALRCAEHENQLGQLKATGEAQKSLTDRLPCAAHGERLASLEALNNK